MKIDQYICDLLHEHDCVIVTDLGGFIANYKPAYINPALHVLYPPSKKIAFNSSLKNNDGLLANYIASKSALSYADACEIIKDYVTQASDLFRQGNRLKIENIGMLFRDSDNNLQFLPDNNMNYLVSSFGLTSVHAPAIKREHVVIGQEMTRRRSSYSKHSSKTKLKKRGWSVLEVIPAAAVLTFLLLVPPVLNELNTNLGTLLPFSRINEYIHDFRGGKELKNKVTINYISPFDIPPARISGKTASATVDNTGINSDQITAQPEEPLIENINEIIVNESPGAPSVEPSVEPAPVSIAANKYHIIGGCFRKEENARNFILELKSRGIEAEIIGQNSGGLFMVSVFKSESFPQVNDALYEFKTSVINTAWVYKK